MLRGEQVAPKKTYEGIVIRTPTALRGGGGLGFRGFIRP